MNTTEKILSKLELVTDLVADLIKKIATFPFSQEDVFKIKVALEEALTNAIRHGNKLDPNLYVTVTLVVEGKILNIKVQDEGSGFDFNQVADPTSGLNSLRTSGRGVYLMKSFMDKVVYHDMGRCVEMVKFMSSDVK